MPGPMNPGHSIQVHRGRCVSECDDTGIIPIVFVRDDPERVPIHIAGTFVREASRLGWPETRKTLWLPFFTSDGTLHRLGVYAVLGRSLKTTNCIESVNALVEQRCAKVDHWKNSSQRQRWLASALEDIEPRLRKVVGYRHLPKLREALKRELKLETKKSTASKKKKVA